MSYPKYFKSEIFSVKVISPTSVVEVCTMNDYEEMQLTKYGKRWDPDLDGYTGMSFEINQASEAEFREAFAKVMGKLVERSLL